jgi:6,7-dimethyl-8-ribityllumazine synthase
MASKGNEALLKQLPELKNAGALHIAIVSTEWNAAITDELERGARNVLQQAGVKKVVTYKVPGAVEVPYMIRQIDANVLPLIDAYIAFACVIRGDTPHFDYVCQSITQGITQLNLTLNAPVIYGVLTVNEEQQAIERIGGAHGHKGEEAAITALKMIALKKRLTSY